MSRQTSVDLLWDMIPKDIQNMIEKQFDGYNKAKAMHKEEIKEAIKNELKLIGNYFDVSKLEQREQGHHIRFTSILKDRFDFYNETFGGNDESDI